MLIHNDIPREEAVIWRGGRICKLNALSANYLLICDDAKGTID